MKNLNNLPFIKKVLILTFIFVVLCISISYFIQVSKKIKVKETSCIKISQKDENTKYCTNIEGDVYKKIFEEKGSKYKTEETFDVKGNLLEKKYIDLDENNNEIGSLELVFDLKHQLLSEIAKGTFGNYRNESFYDVYKDRKLLIQFKDNEETPYQIVYFRTNEHSEKEAARKSLND